MTFKLITKEAMNNMVNSLTSGNDYGYVIRSSPGTARNCSTPAQQIHRINQNSHVYFRLKSAICSGCNLQYVQDEVYVQSSGSDNLVINDGSSTIQDNNTGSFTFCTLNFSQTGTHSNADQLGWWIFPSYVPTQVIKDRMIDLSNGVTQFQNIWNIKRKPYTQPIYLNDHNYRHPVYDPVYHRLTRKKKGKRRDAIKWT